MQNNIMICVDKGQKDGKHEVKHKEIAMLGNLQFVPLPFGDYILATSEVMDIIKRRGDNLKKMDFCGVPKIAIDSKANIEEVYGNIIGKSHARFKDECILAKNNGCKLIVLVENENNIKCIEEVGEWKNPRIFMWKSNIRKIFTDKQKELFTIENALLFLQKRNMEIVPKGELYTINECDKIKKEYFKKLKEVPIEDILKYFKKAKIKYRKSPADGKTLKEAMETMTEKYGVEFRFCTKKECGNLIIDLLVNFKGEQG